MNICFDCEKAEALPNKVRCADCRDAHLRRKEAQRHAVLHKAPSTRDDDARAAYAYFLHAADYYAFLMVWSKSYPDRIARAGLAADAAMRVAVKAFDRAGVTVEPLGT